ncbi:MAG: hypothetical protein R3D25_07995 [Geminicoccaceae bacterium]
MRPGAVPERRQALEEHAEGVFRIRLPDRCEPAGAGAELLPDIDQAAIVGEEMHPAAELAHEGVRVGEARSAGRRIVHMGDDTGAGERLRLDEPDERTVAGRLRL